MIGDNGISIAIIGGGIGGLTAALCLRKIGIDVHVYEQSRALREVGAGINMTPNATRIIHALGLGEGLAKLGVMPTACISGAGMMAARCCAPRLARKSNAILVSVNTSRTAPMYSICLSARSRPSAYTSAIGWFRSASAATRSKPNSRTARA